MDMVTDTFNTRVNLNRKDNITITPDKRSLP